MEEIESIHITQNTVSNIYTVEVRNSKGNESVIIGVDKGTNTTHLIDYKVSEVQTTVEASESEVSVEVKTGMTVVKTSNKTAIEENEYVKKVMEEVGVPIDLEGVVSVVIKSAENSVEAVVTLKKETSLEVIVGVVDADSGDVKFIAEKELEVDLEECSTGGEMLATQKTKGVCEKYGKGQIIETESVLQTTVVSSQIYQQVLTHNVKLQHVTNQLVSDYPILEGIVPADTTIEVIGDKILFTFAFEEQKLLLQYSSGTTAEVSELVSQNLIPEDIKPIVFHTETIANGTNIIRSNKVQ